MGQDYTITWVGDQTKPWKGQKGSYIDYFIAVDGHDGSMKLTQVPETAAPQVGQLLHGHIETETKTNRQTGEEFEAVKFQKEQRPDFQRPQAHASVAARRPQNGGEPKQPTDDTYWLKKNRRMARAGIVQAIIASGKVELGGVSWVTQVNGLADDILDSLNKITPQPGDEPAEVTEQEAQAILATDGAAIGPSTRAVDQGNDFGDDDDIPF